MEQIITLFALIMISLFTYLKILHLDNVSILKIILGILFSSTLAYFVFILRIPIPYTRFAIMVLLLGMFAGLMTKTKMDLALTAIIISMGISYGLFLVSAFISAFISVFFVRIFSQSINDILLTYLFLTLQIIFVNLLFKIKRLKNGIPFLKKRGAGVIGLVISGVILIVVVLINNDYITDETLGLFFLIDAILCVVGLILWWRRGLTKLYRKKIKERNTREYEAIIAEKDEQIQKLQANNEFMAKLIHRDNKLLPSMYEAVKICFSKYKENSNNEDMLNSQRTLEQIEQLINERMGLIVQSQRESKTLPSTKDSLIDGVMKYMLAKATEKEIQFDLVIGGDISELNDTVITPIKLETLIADLIENAIIATSHSGYRKILVSIGIAEGFYEFNVQDSGVPFGNGTLVDLGQRKVSTHLDDGGSGIGYMTIFEILREVKASLVITECEPKPYGFTKSVRVRFDNKNEYVVQTYRGNEFSADYEIQNNEVAANMVVAEHLEKVAEQS